MVLHYNNQDLYSAMKSADTEALESKPL